MGRIDIILKDDLEKKFRETVYQKYGMKRGNLTEAVNNAIESWVDVNETMKRANKNKLIGSNKNIER